MTEQRKLAAVMFTDIAGYTALMSKDEQKTLQILQKNRELQQSLAEKHNGEFLKEMGDGTLLCFQSALDAVRCAVEMQKALKDDPDLQLRIGVHLGDIVFKEGDIFGNGVNIASRLEPLAKPGGICLSEQVFHSVRNLLDIKVISLGRQKLKNVDKPVKVYSLVSAEWKPARVYLEKLKQKLSAAARMYYLIGGLFLIGAYFIIFQTDLLFSRTVPSIGVLYLKNLGNPADEYFSYGVTEDIIIDLSKAGTLYVPAINDILAFKDSEKSLTEISAALRVKYILTGSIRRDSAGVRLAMQLVEPKQNKTLWSERWETPLSKVPSIKNKIIRNIAENINLRPSRGASQRFEFGLVPSADAYEFYLKGRYKYQYVKTYEDVTVARGMYEKAIELDSTFIMPLVELAGTYTITGEFDQALQHYRNALSRAIRLQQAIPEAMTRNDMGSVLVNLGQYDQAIQQFDTALAISQRIGDKYSTAGSLRELGVIYDETGQYDKALKNFNQSLEIAKAIENKHMEYMNLNSIGIVYNHRGDREKALDFFSRSLKLRLELDDQHGAGVVLYNIGILQESGGDYTGAVESFNQALEISEKIGDRSGKAYVLDGLGGVYYSLGNLSKSKSMRMQALQILDDIGDSSAVAYVLHNISSIYVEEEKYDSALTAVNRSLAIFTELQDIRMTANDYTILGNIHFMMDDHAKAAAYLEQAVSLLDTLGGKVEILEPFSFLLLSKEMTGDTAYVTAKLPSLEAKLSEVEDKYIKPIVLLNIGKIYLMQGDTITAGKYLDPAYEKVKPFIKSSEEDSLNMKLGPEFRNYQEILELWANKKR